MRAVLWAAVSSDEQAGPDKASLPNQVKECEQAAARAGMDVVETLIVNGHSRSYVNYDDAIRNVPQYARLRELADVRAFDVLIVHSADRLGRTRALLAWVEEYLEKSAVQVWDLRHGKPPIDKDRFLIRGAPALLSAVTAGAARDDNSDRVEKWWDSMRAKVETGGHVSSLPFGYVVDKNDGSVHVDQERAAIVVWAFREYTAGRSLADVATEFTRRCIDLAESRGETPPLDDRLAREATGKKKIAIKKVWKKAWAGAFPTSPRSVKAMFRRRFFVGETRLQLPEGHSEVYVAPRDGKGSHEPIIPTELFAAVGARLDELDAKVRYPARSYALSGVVRCGVCGNLVAVHSKGTNRKYLRCRTCRVARKYEEVEWLVIYNLLRVEESRDIILSRIPDNDQEERQRLQETVLRCRAELQGRQVRVDRWAEAFATGQLTPGALMDKYQAEQKALDKAERDLAKAEQRLATLPTPDKMRKDAEDFIERRAALLAARLRVRDDRAEAGRVRKELIDAEVMVEIYPGGASVAVCNVPLADLLPSAD